MADKVQRDTRGKRVKVHIQGFDDPLTGYLNTEAHERLQGRTVAATVRSQDLVLVVNHEEQYSATYVTFEDPLVGRKVSEVFREGRRAKVAYSPGTEELRISF